MANNNKRYNSVFPFPNITENTANIIKPNKGRNPSLVKLFALFEFHLNDDKGKLYAIAIIFINCKKRNRSIY